MLVRLVYLCRASAHQPQRGFVPRFAPLAMSPLCYRRVLGAGDLFLVLPAVANAVTSPSRAGIAARSKAVTADIEAGEARLEPVAPESARSSAVRRLAGRQRKSASAAASALSGLARPRSIAMAAASSASLPRLPRRPSQRVTRPRLAGVATSGGGGRVDCIECIGRLLLLLRVGANAHTS